MSSQNQPKNANQKSVSKETVIIKERAVKKNNNNKPKKQKKKQATRNSSKDCYANLLDYPFDTIPCKLGWGTMVPTALGTAVVRGTYTCNADGSIGIFLVPTLGAAGTTSSPLAVCQAGAGTATWGNASWTNNGQFPTTVTDTIRVIAAGLKITPLVAATAAPGIVFAGNIAGESYTEVSSMTITQLQAYSTMTSFVTNNGVIRANSRPLDNTAYEFLPNNYTGSTTAQFPNSFPVVLCTGFPNGATVLIEAVMQFEYIPSTSTSTVKITDTIVDPKENKISKDFNSLENMWDYTVSRIHPSAFIETATAGLNFMTARLLQQRLRGGGQQPQLQ